MPRSADKTYWNRDLAAAAALISAASSDLAYYAAPGVLTDEQRRTLVSPLLVRIDAWLKDYDAFWAELQKAIQDGLAVYGEPLPRGYDTTLTRLVDDADKIVADVATMKGEAPVVPTVAPPPEVAPPEELPDAERVMSDEVARLVLAWQGKDPGKPATWREKIVSAAKSWFDLSDLIQAKRWSTAEEQAAAGAKTGLTAWITQMYGATTFAAFILEEAVQAIGMAGWIAHGAKEYDVAWQCFKEQDKLIRESTSILDKMRPLMPLTYPAFSRYFYASRIANDAWVKVLSERFEALGKPKTATIVVKSKPTHAMIFLDGKDTLLLTPETLKYVSPGTHVVTVAIPATDTKPLMIDQREITLAEGAKAELMLLPAPEQEVP